jgi:hypothetical protein
MAGKTMKEEVDAIDRKILAYCGAIEEAMDPITEIKIDEKGVEWTPYAWYPSDGMDMARAVGQQVQRARNLAWAVQRLPVLDLSFMSSMKKVTVDVMDPTGPRKAELTLPTWVVTSFYPGGAGVGQDPKAPVNESVFNALSMTIPIPSSIVEENRAAIGTGWTRPVATVAAVPASLRRKIDPFVKRFDQIVIIGEAEWRSMPGDPLVVGVFYGPGQQRYTFLLGEYDPTKLEKYVVAELAVKPRG